MKELAKEAKYAILRVLKDIVMADNIIHEKEVLYMKQVAHDMELEEDFDRSIDNIVTLKALTIIRGFTQEQKEEVARLMGRMIVIDEDINYNEVKLYNSVCESCNIEKGFHLEDYPDYSLSGDFQDSWRSDVVPEII